MARDFPGTNGNYLNVGDVAAIDITGTALTIVAWARPDVNNSVRVIVAKRNGPLAENQYALYMNATGKVEVLVSDAVGDDSATGATTLSTGTWQHIGLRKNGTGAGALAAFLNGVSDGSATSNKSIQNSSGIFKIGDSVNFVWDGRIGEVAVWDVALTDAEMAALAKGVSPLLVRPGGLKGFWPLWAVAFPEIDLSGNVNNASQVGTVAAADHAPVGPPVLY